MLILTCPNCGVAADETELAPGGEAHLQRRGPGASEEDFADYLFLRKNPRGVHFERWRHAMGCGKWFHAARCTVTLEVFGTYPAQTGSPPDDLLARIRERRPEAASDGLPGNAPETSPEPFPETGAGPGRNPPEADQH